MPTTKQYGTEGPGNKAIGGIPQIYYFDFASKGRGQVLRLLWEDAGIAYKDTRFEISEEYPKFKKTELAEMNPMATIPVVELNGRILTQSYAILRHFARQLNAYDGTSDEEKYWVDLLCDCGTDWRNAFVTAFLSDNSKETYPAHCKDARPNFLKGLNRHLSAGPSAGPAGAAASAKSTGAGGPFALGDRISYADLVIYQVAHDEGLTKEGCQGLSEYPELKKMCEAVEKRPGVAAFLKSDRYLG